MGVRMMPADGDAGLAVVVADSVVGREDEEGR